MTVSVKNSITQINNEFLEKKLIPVSGSLFYSQYNKILEQVSEKTSVFTIKSEENKEYFENSLLDAFEIIDNIKLAVSSPVKNETAPDNTEYEKTTITEHDHILWFHGDVQSAFYQGYESKYAKKVNRDLMTDQAIKYLHSPCMENELLEWILVDSLMFGEVVSFGEELKQYSAKESFNLNKNYFSAKGNVHEMQKNNVKNYFKNLGNKFVCFFALPILIAFISYQYLSKDSVLIVSTIYLCMLIMFFLIRLIFSLFTRKDRKKLKKEIEKSAALFGAMHSVYDILKNGTISPKYLRDKLYESSKIGAVWPDAVFMIVDHAVNRNPAVWN